MPPIEALQAPVSLRKHKWGQKQTAWQEAMTKSLASEASAPVANCFQELEKVKQVALDCALEVLRTTGGKLCVIPNHSRETRQLRIKARHNLLKAVRLEIRARQNNGSG
jgi:hypothetical protein